MYRALYRKWRPQRFEDVVAQRGIVTALRNQVASGRVGHAYLFTGVRGTGKTTCAKIFAKAVNCLHPKDGDPCGECEICKGIDNGSILDVVEMDAASNNGVDDIRDLRDETAYTPSACHYKGDGCSGTSPRQRHLPVFFSVCLPGICLGAAHSPGQPVPGICCTFHLPVLPSLCWG